MGTQMREFPNPIRTMIITLARSSGSAEWCIARKDVQCTVIEGDSARLRLFEDAGLLCFVFGESVQCKWTISVSCECDCFVQVRLDNRENRAEEFFGEERVSWFYTGHDGWSKESGCSIALPAVDDLAACLLEELAQTVEVPGVDYVGVVFGIGVFASHEDVEVSGETFSQRFFHVWVYEDVIDIEADL